MHLAMIQTFDIVEADTGDGRFFALVTGKQHGRLVVSPITRRVIPREVTVDQVVGHYKRSRDGAPRPTPLAVAA